jgi:methylphosphotriester-DNA--protein-cysteine methyltransferase
MKRKRHTESQIIAKLRQAETERAGGATLEAICKRLEISYQTYLRWRERYAGMQVNQVKRLRELEHENGRLRKLVAQQAMDIDALKDVASKKW